MSDTVLSQSSTNSALFGGNTRTNSTTATLFLNKTKSDISNISVTNNTGYTIYGMCINASGNPLVYSSREQALVWIGLGLTNTDIDNLVDINQTYQTALSRFV